MYAEFVVSRLRFAPSRLRNAAVLASIAIALSAAPAAQAQFSSLSLPTLTEAASNTNGATFSGKAGQSGIFSLGLYPYAPFQFNTDVKDFSFNATNQKTGNTSQAQVSGFSSKFTANGVLFAPEYVYTLPNHRSGIGVGGWYWLHTEEKEESYSGNFDANLFDMHVKYFFTPRLGLEVGYLGQTNTSIPPQEGVNAYVSYALGSGKDTPHGFSATFGLGLQNIEKYTLDSIDTTNGTTTDVSFQFKDTTDLGAYVTGSYYVIPHGSINLSYWLLTGSQDIGVDASATSSSATASGGSSTSQSRTVSRFALGFGYQF